MAFVRLVLPSGAQLSFLQIALKMEGELLKKNKLIGWSSRFFVISTSTLSVIVYKDTSKSEVYVASSLVLHILILCRSPPMSHLALQLPSKLLNPPKSFSHMFKSSRKALQKTLTCSTLPLWKCAKLGSYLSGALPCLRTLFGMTNTVHTLQGSSTADQFL